MIDVILLICSTLKYYWRELQTKFKILTCKSLPVVFKRKTTINIDVPIRKALASNPQNYETYVRTSFECLTCDKYVFPPIRQYECGHNFCPPCFDSIPECPTCKLPRSQSRSFALERIHALLTFPCHYEDKGCTFWGKGEQVVAHQITCQFSVVSCPMRYNRCPWKGFTSDIMMHCIASHPRNAYGTRTQKMLASNFAQIRNRAYFMVFKFSDALFKFCWSLHESTGIMRFVMYCYNGAVVAEDFSFEVAFLKGNTNTEVITIMGPCFPYKEDMEIVEIFADDRCIHSFHHMVARWCDNEGDLNYFVKIIKR